MLLFPFSRLDPGGCASEMGDESTPINGHSFAKRTLSFLLWFPFVTGVSGLLVPMPSPAHPVPTLLPATPPTHGQASRAVHFLDGFRNRSLPSRRKSSRRSPAKQEEPVKQDKAKGKKVCFKRKASNIRQATRKIQSNA